MRTLSLAAILIGAVLFSSCDKKDVALADANSVVYHAPIKGSDVMLDSIAKIICNISSNNALVNEVQKGVNDNLYFGLDEELRLIDVLFPNESKIIKNKSDIATLTEVLRTAFGVKPNSKVDDNLDNLLIEYIVKYDITIYLPYSGHDKTGTLVVAYGTEDTDEKNFPAYSKKGKKLESFSFNLTEEYMQTNSIWIITHNEIPYEKLPKFIDGIFEKDGILWWNEHLDFGDVVKRDPPADDNSDFMSDDFIYEVRLGYVKLTQQLDTKTNGGSEMRFKYYGSKANAAGNGTEKDGDAPTVSKTISRADINAGKVIYIRAILDANLAPNETETQLSIWEEDYGIMTQTIPVKLKYKDYVELSFNIYLQRHDDPIYYLPMSRVNYFSVNQLNVGNGLDEEGFRIYGAGSGLFYSLPYSEVPKVGH